MWTFNRRPLDVNGPTGQGLRPWSPVGALTAHPDTPQLCLSHPKDAIFPRMENTTIFIPVSSSAVEAAFDNRSNSISYNCQKSCSRTRRPETIIRKSEKKAKNGEKVRIYIWKFILTNIQNHYWKTTGTRYPRGTKRIYDHLWRQIWLSFTSDLDWT